MEQAYLIDEINAIADMLYNRRRSFPPSILARARQLLQELGMRDEDIALVLAGKRVYRVRLDA